MERRVIDILLKLGSRPASALLVVGCAFLVATGCSSGDGRRDESPAGLFNPGDRNSAFYEIDFGLTGQVAGRLGAAHFTVIWSGQGSDEYSFSSSNCRARIVDSLSVFDTVQTDNDDNDDLEDGYDPLFRQGTVNVNLSVTDGFPVGVPLASCVVLASARPETGEFSLVVHDASDAQGIRLAALPQLAVLGIVPNDEADSEAGDSPPVPYTETYDLVLRVEGSHQDLGALQFEVYARHLAGGFVGLGDSVGCRSALKNALAAFNNRNGTLRAGFIAVDGVAVPSDLAVCRYRGRPGISLDDFLAVVSDSSDTDSGPVRPPPIVRVFDVRTVE